MTALATYNTGEIEQGEARARRLYAAFFAGRSENTHAAYTQDVERFAAFLGAPSPAAAIGHLIASDHGAGNGLLLDYRAHMIEEGLTPATVNRRLAALRSAVKVARLLGFTSWTPEVDGMKAEAYRDTAGPGLNGTHAMLAQASTQEPVKAARDVALIRLMFALGLRRGECVSLDLSDIDHAGRRVWIKGKGRTQKEVRSLPEKAFAALTHWLQVRGQIAAPGETALFVGLMGPARGRRITGRGVYHVISSIGSDVGIKTRPHGLRHASITAALDANNGDVRAVQQHARHANPQTTIKYDDARRDLAGRISASLDDVL